MILAHINSKNLRTQKLPSCILKAITAISKVSTNLLKFKNTKAHANDISLATLPMVRSSIDSIALFGHVNVEFAQNRHSQVVTCLDSQYQPLGRNANPESQLLLWDDVTKRVMTITENEKLPQNENL